jgi:putative Mn2+ efflux pump MntP
MGLIDILLIGIGLSMDAFAVSICKGLKMKVVDIKQCIMIASFFGVFQALMPIIGYILSIKFVKYINAYSHWVAFVLLLLIGVNMIWEATGGEKPEAAELTCSGVVINLKELFALAIATSLDALAVGVTFGTMGDTMELSIWLSVIIIGMTTFVISIAGVFIGNVFGVKYKQRAEIAGGIVLILIGIKVVIEHYL